MGSVYGHYVDRGLMWVNYSDKRKNLSWSHWVNLGHSHAAHSFSVQEVTNNGLSRHKQLLRHIDPYSAHMKVFKELKQITEK